MMSDRPMHPATAEILRHFEYNHLPTHLAEISSQCSILAHDVAEKLDGPELTAGLRKLLEAKDCFVRAAVVACRCPSGMKYHAINCPSGRGGLMNPEPTR